MKRALVALLTALVATAPSAVAAPGKSSERKTERLIASLFDTVCSRSVEYTNCSRVNVVIDNFGATGWSGQATPSTQTVRFNSYYRNWADPTAYWSTVISHEVGGHVDTWNELVAARGVSGAWTDYYDLDRLAYDFFVSKGYRPSSNTRAKELFLDCVGPAIHGYGGFYLSSARLSVASCSGWQTVMEAAKQP